MDEIFQTSIKVLEQHLDSFGHVNNATYMVFYEEARWDYITQYGFGLDEILKYQQGPVILDAHIRYKRELRNREFIKIETKIEANEGELVGSVFQKIIKEDNSLSSTAEFKMGLMDLKRRKLILPTPLWLKVLRGEGMRKV